MIGNEGQLKGMLQALFGESIRVEVMAHLSRLGQIDVALCFPVTDDKVILSGRFDEVIERIHDLFRQTRLVKYFLAEMQQKNMDLLKEIDEMKRVNEGLHTKIMELESFRTYYEKAYELAHGQPRKAE